MKKGKIGLLLALCMVSTMLAVCGKAAASGAQQPESVSTGMVFALNGDRTSYACTGLGSCTDKRAIIPSEYNGQPVTRVKRDGDLSWVNYVTNEIVIPNTVTTIESETFKYCIDMLAIYIPKSVTSIGKDAFFDCGKLTIFCEAESEAHRYALKQGIACETIAPTQSGSPYPDEGVGSSIKIYSIEELCVLAQKYCQTKYGVTPPYADGNPQAGTVVIQLYSIVRDEHTATTDWLYVDYHGKGTNMFGEKVDLSEFDGAGKQQEAVTGFQDVRASDYFAPAVTWAVEKGITSGTSSTTFSPGTTCTRAQIMTFLWRAAGSPEPKGTATVIDVKSSDYFYKAVLWAAEKKIFSGRTFSPNTPCTRAAAVEFMWKQAGAPNASGGIFTDVPAGASYAAAVSWAVKKGITAGTSKTTFSPDTECSRAQIVTFLYRGMK